jgi:hypothetical protein
MGEYEPDDSRIITQNPSKTPIEPGRTGPAEGATRSGDGTAGDGTAKAKHSDPKEAARWQVSGSDQEEPEEEVKPHAGT